MFNTLTPTTKRKKAKLVGRGKKRGKTSGRGTKGQKSRAGHKIRPMMRDFIKKLPKLRGRGKNGNKAFRARPLVVNLSTLNALFKTGERVSPRILIERSAFVRTTGTVSGVKILATGTLDKKLSVFDCEISTKAKDAIVAAGGSVRATKKSSLGIEATHDEHSA